MKREYPELPPLTIRRSRMVFDLYKIQIGSRWIANYSRRHERHRDKPPIPIEITKEWQDESRTWLTIDEVYATRYDCRTARREAA